MCLLEGKLAKPIHRGAGDSCAIAVNGCLSSRLKIFWLFSFHREKYFSFPL